MRLPGLLQKSLAKVDSLVKKLKSSCKAASDKVSEALGLGNRSTIQNGDLSSPLMCLPPELRNQIWELVLGGRAFHVIAKRQSLTDEQNLADERRDPEITTFTCRSQILDAEAQRRFDKWSDEVNLTYFDTLRHSVCRRVPRHKAFNCSLLRTCRSIYLETKNFKYFSNTFVFTDFMPLGQFPQALGCVNRSLISSIQLDICISSRLEETSWNEKIRLIAREMTSLKEIHIFIEWPKGRPTPSRRIWGDRAFSMPFLPRILDLKELRLRSMTLVVWDTRSYQFPRRARTTNTRLMQGTFRSTTVEKHAWACEMRRAVLRL